MKNVCIIINQKIGKLYVRIQNISVFNIPYGPKYVFENYMNNSQTLLVHRNIIPTIKFLLYQLGWGKLIQPKEPCKSLRSNFLL
jgi:hypothetical protein